MIEISIHLEVPEQSTLAVQEKACQCNGTYVHFVHFTIFQKRPVREFSTRVDWSIDVPDRINLAISLSVMNQFENDVCQVAEHHYFKVDLVVPFIVRSLFLPQLFLWDLVQVGFDLHKSFANS